MIYRVRHVTEYLLRDAVSTSHHELHLLPRVEPGQTVHAESLIDHARAGGAPRSRRLVRQPRRPTSRSTSGTRG